jgi:hypothetical protein
MNIKKYGWHCENNKGEQKTFWGEGESREAIIKRLARFLAGDGFVRDEVGLRCIEQEQWRVRPIGMVFLDEVCNENND